MPYRELTMIEIKEVVRRYLAKQSIHRIARETGLDRKTVRRYVAAAKKLSLSAERPLVDEDVDGVAKQVQARPASDPTQERAEVAQHRAQIEEWLGRKRPLRLRKIHVLLMREGLRTSYSTLRRYVMEELGWQKKGPTVLLDDPPPGQEAQVDFGKMGMILDEATGRQRLLWALVVTMSLSRYAFVWPTFRQTTEAVCEGLDRAWSFFGVKPQTILPDNAKAIIVKADALDPVLTEAFADYAQARDIFVDPARVRSPRDKARVENQVPYVRESWFDGETFAGLEDARKSAEQWSRETAGGRIHGTTRQVPREVFEAVEKPVMKAAPTEPFDVPLWTEAKVHPDHHIQVAHGLYSVPTIYLYKQVRVRADKKLVRIYFGTELIKVHARVAPGKRSTDVNDYPVGKAMYALRSVDGLVNRAKEKGRHVGAYAERLVAGPLPWTRMRQGYALLRLCDKYGPERVDSLCQRALVFDVVDVHRIARMLKEGTKAGTPDKPPRGKLLQMSLPRFARAQEHFETRPVARSKKEGE